MLKPYRTPQTYFRTRDHNQRFEHENDIDISKSLEIEINSHLNNVYDSIHEEMKVPKLDLMQSEDYE